jgi:hypothetical protein
MAKQSQIERQKRRERLVARYATRRGELLVASDDEGLKKLGGSRLAVVVNDIGHAALVAGWASCLAPSSPQAGEAQPA